MYVYTGEFQFYERGQTANAIPLLFQKRFCLSKRSRWTKNPHAFRQRECQYRDLLAYKDAPSQQMAEKLRSEFWKLFDTQSGYKQLDERTQLTLLKISELLLVLEHPELPLHNNPAELAARTMVQRGNISYATQTLTGDSGLGYFYVPCCYYSEITNQLFWVCSRSHFSTW